MSRRDSVRQDRIFILFFVIFENDKIISEFKFYSSKRSRREQNGTEVPNLLDEYSQRLSDTLERKLDW